MATIRGHYGTWYGAVYWPWVQCMGFDGSGILKFYPPSGFAAGACAQVDRTIGFHKAPANIAINAAVDVERLSGGQAQVDDGVREYLNGKDVNVIAPLPGVPLSHWTSPVKNLRQARWPSASPYR